MPKTIYFLGAEASHASDFNLPLMKGFFRKEDFFQEKYSHLRQFIEDRFPKVPFEEIDKINMEEVITHLDLILEGFRWDSIEVSAEAQTLTEFSRYVENRLGTLGKRICSKHIKLFEDISMVKVLFLCLIMT